MAKTAPRLQTTPTRVAALMGALIGLAIAAALWALRPTNAFTGLEWRIVDARTQAFMGQRKPDPDLVLAEVRGDDLAAINPLGYKWPWPLFLTANAFEWFRAAGARAVIVDVYQFDRGVEPEEYGLTDKESKEYQEAKAMVDAADELAAAYRPPTRVVLAVALSSNPPEIGPAGIALRRPAFEKRLTRIPPLDVRPGMERPHVNLPALKLLDASHGIGFASTLVDDDGVLRRGVPVGSAGGRRLPSLPLAAVFAMSDDVEVADGRIRVGRAEQRLSDDGTFLVAFRGPSDTYPRISPAQAVLAGGELANLRAGGDQTTVPGSGGLKPEDVRGKIVLWGVNPDGVKDVVSAPVGSAFSGPEFQLTLIDNLLHGDGRWEVSRTTNGLVLLGFCALLGLLGGVAKRRGVFLTATLVAAGIVWGGGYWAFGKGVSFDLFTPSLGILMTYAGVLAFKTLTEGRRNKWLEGTFSQYLAPAVIKAIKADPSMLALGGRQREVSVLFSDVKGFTTISETLGPENTVRLLNDYLSRQSEPVLQNDGVIDKFIGDAVMAFFGEPVAHADHALRACRAAVESLAVLAGTQPLAKELGLGTLVNRIGVASGPATIGNIGSDRRFNYTAIGDTVNFASRLEGANKAFGSRILLADATYQAAKDAVLAKPLAKLIVVGKTEPVPVHELIALVESASPEQRAHAEAFGRAHALLLADDLDGAETALAEAEKLVPDDGPCRWLGGIIDGLRLGMIARPWNGVYVLESK